MQYEPVENECDDDLPLTSANWPSTKNNALALTNLRAPLETCLVIWVSLTFVEDR